MCNGIRAGGKCRSLSKHASHNKIKIKAYLSKLVLLLMYSFGAIFMSVAIFSIGFRELLHELDFDYLFYSIAACIIFGSHIIFISYIYL